MGVFKEINKADGSGVTVFYRTNLASTFDISDLDIDTESVLYKTGKEISLMTEDKPNIVLCTEDYIYTDIYGTLMSVERGTIYEMDHGTIVDTIAVGGGGGGGGVPRSNLTTAISPLEQNVSIKATVKLAFHFLTTAIKKTGTAKLYVNNTLKSTMTVNSGEDYEFDVSKYLKLGSNYFTIRTSDDNGAEKNFDFLVNAVQLILSSGFNGDIPIQNTFNYIYRIKGSGEKIVHFILDGDETTVTTTTSDVDLTQTFSNLSHGTHSLVVYATAELDGEEMESNTLSYSLLTYNPTSSDVIIRSNFNTESCMEGEQLKIDYLVYDPANLIANVGLYINNELATSATADRTTHIWNVSNYPTGTVVFKIQCGSVYVEKTVEVEPISVDIHEATEGLELKLTTYNRSNQEVEPGRSTWHYNDIYAQMNNFNWQSDGWIDNKLRLKGQSNVVIPFQPFSTDLRRTGKTIEFEFITSEVFNADSRLITCMDTNGIGFEVKVDSSKLTSEQQIVSTLFGVGNKIRISFVIEPSSSNRLIKTYINGVLSGLKQYSMDDNFQQVNPTNIIINPDEEEIDVTSIRVYNRALNAKEIVNNWIYDMSDISEKINTFNENQIYDYYGNISYAKIKNYLPVVIVTGAMPTYKGDKKKVSVRYEHNLKTNYNFEQENCTIDVQGTSSQYYPRKNWKIKLVDKVQVDDGWIEEKTYCMKADFMESSHTYNIGTATLINDLYDSEYYYPTRTVDNGVRDTMNGFPCVLFTKESEEADMVFGGTFMFNNDKADTDTLGYTIDEAYAETSESWEFKNNTSDHCLWKSADFSAAANPLDDFEARYPDGYEDFTALSRVFSWVVSCKDNPTKFKQEFENYFDLHYCLIYQVMMEVAIMVDSRAKNMFLDTADGVIWYPRFYDMDTCWGLNNEGVPAWSYDVEIHDQVGSAYVWDDRGASEFWNLFEEAYADEIKDMYHSLREEKLTYDSIMHYYIENISDNFSASAYNEDSEYKYIGPLLDEGNATYLYAAQGNRQDYFRWIVEKRLIYLDSKYEYGDFNSDYATMRWYTTTGDLTITTHQTMYIKVRFGSTDVKQRIEYNTPTVIHAPAGLEFNDTEVIIWGASQIVDFGSLSNKYPGTVDVSRCTKLQRLVLGETNRINTNLISLSLGNNPMLRDIQLINCTNLAGSLDLSGCTDLRRFNARETKLTSFTLSNGSVIEELYLPRTLTSLTLKGVKSLRILEAQSYVDIRSLIYEDSSYSLDDLLSKCGGLTRIRIVFDNDYSSTMDIDGIIYYYNNMMGIDEHGDNLPLPYIAGCLNIEIQNYHTEEEIQEYKSIILNNSPNLNPNYVNINSKFGKYTYYYRQSGYWNYRFEHLGNNIIAKVDNTGEGKKPAMACTSYTTIPENPPQNTIFIALESSDSASGILYLPEKIRGIDVMLFGVTTANAARNITGLIFPSSYRMFDLDFYIDNYLMQSAFGGVYLNYRSLYNPGYENYYAISMAGSSSGIGYTSNANWTSGLQSVVYGGRATYIPPFWGTNLSTFSVNTENVLVWGRPSWLVERLGNQNQSYFPFPLNNIKTVCYSGGSNDKYFTTNEQFNITSFSGLMLSPYKSGSTTYGVSLFSNGYFGNLDCNWTDIGDGCHLASKAEIYDFNSRGITNLDKVSSNLCFYRPFDATNINKLPWSLHLNYTTPENPQVFPDITTLAWGGDYTSSPANPDYQQQRMYISVPNCTEFDIQCNNVNLTLGIKEDRLFKLVSSGSAQSFVGWNAVPSACPWLKRGLDCSEVNRDFTLVVGGFWGPGPKEEIQEFGGLINLGQSFTSAHTIGLNFAGVSTSSSQVDKDSARTVILSTFNTIYDLTQKNITSTLSLGQAKGLMTAEEIAIATAKGWTVS